MTLHCRRCCCHHHQAADAAQAAWQASHELQAAVSAMAGSTQAVSRRMAGIKMCEQAVLLYTSHQAQALPLPAAKAAVAAAANATVQQLTALLGGGADAVRAAPGPVVVCALRALCTLAQQRPQLLDSLLPPLLALANEVCGGRGGGGAVSCGGRVRCCVVGSLSRVSHPLRFATATMACADVGPAAVTPMQVVFKAPAADDGQPGVAASCGATLRDVLLRLLRGCSGSAAARPWAGQLEAALRAMGAGATADAGRKYLDKMATRWDVCVCVWGGVALCCAALCCAVLCCVVLCGPRPFGGAEADNTRGTPLTVLLLRP
jgi:hypothetical protein